MKDYDESLWDGCINLGHCTDVHYQVKQSTYRSRWRWQRWNQRRRLWDEDED